jgi:hypothetical protein
MLSRSNAAVAFTSRRRAKGKAAVSASIFVLCGLALCGCGQRAAEEIDVNHHEGAAAAAQPVTGSDGSNGSEPDYVNIEAAAVQPILDDCRQQRLTDDQCYQRTQAAAFEADAKADGQTTVSAADLYGAFLANEAAAEDRYHGPLLVNGVSGGVQRNSGLSGFLGGYTLTVIPGVQASISRKDGASIQFGSKVMLACGSVGYSRDVVALGSCSLKSAAPITLEDNAKDLSALGARTGAQ